MFQAAKGLMVRTLAHNADVEFRTVGHGAVIVPSPWITNLVSRNGGLGWHGRGDHFISKLSACRGGCR